MKVQDENAGRSSMLVLCRKISSAVWKKFSTGVIYVELHFIFTLMLTKLYHA